MGGSTTHFNHLDLNLRPLVFDHLQLGWIFERIVFHVIFFVSQLSCHHALALLPFPGTTSQIYIVANAKVAYTPRQSGMRRLNGVMAGMTNLSSWCTGATTWKKKTG